MQGFIRFVDRMNLALGNGVAPVSLVVTVIVLLEVTARYLFDSPTSWANEVNQYLLCALVMFGGGYTLSKYGHTKVDILHVWFPRKVQAMVEILIGVCVIVIAGPIIWYGAILTVEAIQTGQTSVSGAELPLWPSMATVPLGALFLGLQGMSNALHAIKFLASPEATPEREMRS